MIIFDYGYKSYRKFVKRVLNHINKWWVRDRFEEAKLYCTEALKDPNLTEEKRQTVVDMITSINMMTELQQNAISTQAVASVGMFAPPVVAAQESPSKDDTAILEKS